MTIIEELNALLDEAVGEGRQNWDGYYGSNNSYHMNTIKESGNYKRLVHRLERLQRERNTARDDASRLRYPDTTGQ